MNIYYADLLAIEHIAEHGLTNPFRLTRGVQEIAETRGIPNRLVTIPQNTYFAGATIARLEAAGIIKSDPQTDCRKWYNKLVKRHPFWGDWPVSVEVRSGIVDWGTAEYPYAIR